MATPLIILKGLEQTEFFLLKPLNTEHNPTGQLLVKRKERICTLTMNRPEKRNVLTPGFLKKMTDTLLALGSDQKVKTIIIQGAGHEAFSAGYDISALPVKGPSGTAAPIQDISPLECTLQAIRNFPYPVIAMLNGHAFGGGCELAVACDIRIGRKGITMGMPPARLGLVYPPAGFRRFLTVLGFSRTLEIFLTGRQYDSRSCLNMGLLNYVLERDRLEGFTHELARDISQNSPLALRGTKTALYKIADATALNPQDEARLTALFAESMKSEDLNEGKRAFMEKRKPCFKGR